MIIKEKKNISSKINLKLMNDLKIQNIPSQKFPIKRFLDMMPKKDSLFETVLVSANDTLVNLFLEKKILFNEIHSKLFKILSLKKFNSYKKKTPKNIREITILYEYVRLKTQSLSVV